MPVDVHCEFRGTVGAWRARARAGIAGAHRHRRAGAAGGGYDQLRSDRGPCALRDRPRRGGGGTAADQLEAAGAGGAGAAVTARLPLPRTPLLQTPLLQTGRNGGIIAPLVALVCALLLLAGG